MSNLISRDKAIEAVVCHIWHMPNESYKLFNCENVVREVVEDAINRLPLAEAIEVVRCKDCKWHRICKVFSNNAWHDDDYCSYGEYKGGENK